MFGLDLQSALPLAVDWNSLTSSLFWLNVGVLAGIYALLALGLQLNVGFTGITNFGQAGFMAIGAYTMAILTVNTGIVVLALAAALDARRDALRTPRRPSVAAPARGLLRDRDDRQRRGRPGAWRRTGTA